jgi:competence protein ComEC
VSFLQILRTYLIVAVTLSFIAGISFSFFFPLSYFSLAPLSAIALLLGVCIWKFQNTGVLLLLLFFFYAGIYSSNIATAQPTSPEHIVNTTEDHEETIILGRVAQVFSYDGEITRFDVNSLASRNSATTFETVHGKIRYIIKDRLPDEIIPGVTVAVRARLKRPQRFLTPGSFDYPSFLAEQDIYITGYISSPIHLEKVRSTPTFFNSVQYFPQRIRHTINSFIDTSLSDESAAVYKALLTGDRSSLSPHTIELFKGTGVLHILAISGIHMSLLGVFLFALIFWLLRRSEQLILTINTKKTAAFLSIPPLLFYTLIAGAKTPVLRSFVMSLIIILAVCFGKKHSFITLVAAAALLILTLSPESLASPSLQLTFTAVLAIGAGLPVIFYVNRQIADFKLPKMFLRFLTWIVAALGVSLAATLGTAPLVIYHFNRISLVGIITNLIVEPLICLWSLTIGFCATLCIFIAEPIAHILFQTGSFGIHMALKAVSFFHALPHSSIYLPSPSYLHVSLYYLGFLSLALWNSVHRSYRPVLLLLPVSTMLFLAFPPAEISKFFREESSLTFLDVGHGSCTLLETPGGKRILIDGGAISSPEFNIGERVIAPFLFRSGIAKVDDIIVTHPDSDHYNGIAFLLHHFKVKSLWVSTREHNSPGWHTLLKTASDRKVVVHVPHSGKIYSRNSENFLDVVANTNSSFSVGSNEKSLVLKYRHGDFTALFPGDIPREIEKKLIRQGSNLSADVLLAVHHGSATSNSREFLQYVSPEIMIVSSGRNRSFNFPSPVVLERCAQQHINVQCIKEIGTIEISTAKGGYQLDTLLSL